MHRLFLAIIVCVLAVSGPAGAAGCFETKNPQEMVGQCSDAVSAATPGSPEHIRAQRRRAYGWYLLKDYKKALADIDAAVAGDSQQAKSYQLRAYILDALGENKKALADVQRAVKLDPDKVRLKEDLAYYQNETRNFAEALKTYDGLIAAYPAAARYAEARGMVYQNMGNDTKALADFDQALRLWPVNGDYWCRRGQLYARIGLLTKAEADLRRASDLAPENAYAKIALARTVLDLNRPGESLAILDRVLASQGFSDAYLGRAAANFNLGNLDAAESDVAAAMQMRDADELWAMVLKARIAHARGADARALAYYAEAARRWPDAVDWHYWRGLQLADGQAYGKALADFDAVLRIDPSDQFTNLERAKALNALDRWQEALKAADRALATNPDFADAHAFRAYLLNSDGQYGEALAAASRAIALDPQGRDGFYRRAYAHWWLGNYQQAEADYNSVIAIDPQYASAFSERAAVRNELGNYEGAREDVIHAIALDNTNAVDFVRLGDIMSSLGDDVLAVAAYRRALILDPSDAWTRIYRSTSLARQENFSQAMEDCQKALELMPKSPAGYWCVGNVRAAQRLTHAAVAAFRQALKLNPVYGPALYDRGRMLMQEGKYDQARADFSAAISRNYRKSELFLLRGDSLQELGLPGPAIKDYRAAVSSGVPEVATAAAIRMNRLRSKAPPPLHDLPGYPQQSSAGPFPD
ncbi:tetratricopeptide repeat protein [Aestuariivirga sp.]|uniref:tetratricopeptide repeat protein n=1 Tax=Aestuariivirga sp. TaxID=2650926 RepID=UPI0039E62858